MKNLKLCLSIALIGATAAIQPSDSSTTTTKDSSTTIVTKVQEAPAVHSDTLTSQVAAPLSAVSTAAATANQAVKAGSVVPAAVPSASAVTVTSATQVNPESKSVPAPVAASVTLAVQPAPSQSIVPASSVMAVVHQATPATSTVPVNLVVVPHAPVTEQHEETTLYDSIENGFYTVIGGIKSFAVDSWMTISNMMSKKE